MVNWWTRHNFYMVKCQNTMVVFSYLRLLLSHPLINEKSESEEGCPHQFLIHIRPLKPHPPICILLSPYSCPHCLPRRIPLPHGLYPPPHYVPLLLPILHLHVFPHIRPLKIHPPLCVLLHPSSCTHCIPLHLPLSHDLHPPLHYIPLLIPLLHLHVFPHIRPLKLHFPLLVLILFLFVSLFLTVFILLFFFLILFLFLFLFLSLSIILTYIFLTTPFIQTK